MAETGAKTRHVKVRLTEQQFAELQTRAKRYERTVSAEIRLAVNLWIARTSQ